jgi:hypothetical protein
MDNLVYVESLFVVLQSTRAIVHEVSQFQTSIILCVLLVQCQLQILECELLVQIKSYFAILGKGLVG